MIFKVSEVAKKKYFDRKVIEFKACPEALKSCDFNFFFKLGHQLKGSASTFGFDELALLGEQLEDISKEKNISGIEALLKQIDNYIIKIQKNCNAS